MFVGLFVSARKQVGQKKWLSSTYNYNYDLQNLKVKIQSFN